MHHVQYAIRYFFLSIGCALDAVLTLSFSYALSFLIDSILLSGGYENFTIWVLITLFLAVAGSFSSVVLAQYLPLKEELKCSVSLSQQVLMNLLAMNYRNYSQHDKGYYYNVVTNSAFTYGSSAMDSFIILVGNILIVAITIGTIFLIHPILGFLFFLYIPLTGLSSVKPGKISSKYQAKGLPTQDAFLNETRRIIESKREIDISGTSNYFMNRYIESSNRFLDFVTRFRLYVIIADNIPVITNRLYSILLLSVAAILFFQKSVTLGMIFFLYQALNFVSQPITQAFTIWIRRKVNQTNIDRVHSMYDLAQQPS